MKFYPLYTDLFLVFIVYIYNVQMTSEVLQYDLSAGESVSQICVLAVMAGFERVESSKI